MSSEKKDSFSKVNRVAKFVAFSLVVGACFGAYFEPCGVMFGLMLGQQWAFISLREGLR